MKISFVGKGGSGKTTLSALFASYISISSKTLLIDADINVNLPQLFVENYKSIKKLYISTSENTKDIKTHLIGNNTRIKNLATFRKTTPPAEGSNFVIIGDESDYIISKYGINVSDNLKLMLVGTYESEKIGASCYHNNLAVLENILSHMKVGNSTCVVDMVAGTDAFASSLYMQFDITILVIEPTKKGLDLWRQYKELAKEAGTYNSLYVIINKVEDEEDINYIKNIIPYEKIIGHVRVSRYIKKIEKYGGVLDFANLEKENKSVFKDIKNLTDSITINQDKKLQKLQKLHKKYISQGFITERYGDLSHQIDLNFTFNIEDE